MQDPESDRNPQLRAQQDSSERDCGLIMGNKRLIADISFRWGSIVRDRRTTHCNFVLKGSRVRRWFKQAAGRGRATINAQFWNQEVHLRGNSRK